MVSTSTRCGVLLLIVCCFTLTWGQRSTNVMKRKVEILDDILSAAKYDVRIRPMNDSAHPSPTVVNVNMFIRSIGNIDDVQMLYDIQVTLRQQWIDDRLKFDDMGGKIKFLDLIDTDLSKFWIPDLFFSNEKTGHTHDIVKPNMYVRIFPSGSVLYSSRISLTMYCPMNLKNYPFDTQVCTLRMASYGYTTDDLIFLWKELDPVQVVKNLQLQHFTLTKFLTDFCNSKTNTGEYSCLKVDMLFSRNLGYYLMQVFIPSTMLVIVSWISFWLDCRATTTRLMIVISSLLILSVQVSAFNAKMAVVSYTRSIDNWTGICLTFIFAALMEVVVVDYRLRTMSKKERCAAGILGTTADEENGTAFDMNPLVNTQPETPAQNRTNQTDVGQGKNLFYRWLSKLPTGPTRIDVISRILFPASFALYNICYWLANLRFGGD